MSPTSSATAATKPSPSLPARRATRRAGWLAGWCDLAIFTGPGQQERFPEVESVVWPLPENPRPYNADTLALVRAHLERSGL